MNLDISLQQKAHKLKTSWPYFIPGLPDNWNSNIWCIHSIKGINN